MAKVRLLDGKPLLVSGKVALSDSCCCGGGACCVGTNCSASTREACDAVGGLYMGDDSVCDDTICNCQNGDPIRDLLFFDTVTIRAEVSSTDGCSVISSDHVWTAQRPATPPGSPPDGMFWLYRDTHCNDRLLTDGVNQCFGFNETIDPSHSIGAEFCYAAGFLGLTFSFNCPSGSGSPNADETYSPGSLNNMPGTYTFSHTQTILGVDYNLSGSVTVE